MSFRLLILPMLAVLALRASATELEIFTEEVPPISFMQRGVAAGCFVDVVREIQRRVGNQDSIQIVPWPRAYHLALTEPNIVIFVALKTESRQPLFQWVGPLASVRVSFYTMADRGILIASIEDAMRLKSIGAMQDSFAESELTRLEFHNLERTSSVVQMIKKLLSGRDDAILADDLFVDSFFRDNKDLDRSRVVQSYTLAESEMYIAFSRSTAPDIVLSWQNALDSMKRDGTFAKLVSNRVSVISKMAEPEINAKRD